MPIIRTCGRIAEYRDVGEQTTGDRHVRPAKLCVFQIGQLPVHRIIEIQLEIAVPLIAGVALGLPDKQLAGLRIPG